MKMKKILSSFFVLLLGFCFVVAAIVSLSTVIVAIASINVNEMFSLGISFMKTPVREQLLLTLLYAAELAVGALFIKWGWKLW